MLDYYERDVGVMAKVRQTGSVFFDVGANEGPWTLTLGPGYKQVYAFEPDPRAALALLANLQDGPNSRRRDMAHVSVVRYALSDKEGQIELQMFDTSAHTCIPGSRQLIDDDTRTKLGAPMKMDCTTLDAHVARFALADRYDLKEAFIKIDVEGAEGLVLIGATDTLALHTPDILVEVHSEILREQCRSFLEHGFGYECEVIYNPGYHELSPYREAHVWLNCHKKRD